MVCFLFSGTVKSNKIFLKRKMFVYSKKLLMCGQFFSIHDVYINQDMLHRCQHPGKDEGICVWWVQLDYQRSPHILGTKNKPESVEPNRCTGNRVDRSCCICRPSDGSIHTCILNVVGVGSSTLFRSPGKSAIPIPFSVGLWKLLVLISHFIFIKTR